MHWRAQAGRAADPEEFFLGEFAGGEPIGCVSAVAYDKHYGFLGFYIVKPQYRGRDFGLQLWDAAMAYLEGAMWAWTASSPSKDYRESGFKLAYRNIRHQGEGGGAEPSGLLDLSSVAFDEIARYDGTVERHGTEPVFETARMYTKGSPAGRIDRCFGVTTFELG